jgi:hypothetical protein
VRRAEAAANATLVDMHLGLNLQEQLASLKDVHA